MSTTTPDILKEYGSVLVLGVMTAWFVGRQLTPDGSILSPTTLVGFLAWSAAALAFFGVVRWSR
jgi:hypothetical protein